MKCEFRKIDATNDDCEECHSERRAEAVCFRRGLVWGSMRKEPRWVYTLEEAMKINTDVSIYLNDAPEPAVEKFIKPRDKRHHIPPSIRWTVWERDNFTCLHCGVRRNLSIDHIYPTSKGGETTLDNLQTLCRSCNSRKGNSIMAVENNAR